MKILFFIVAVVIIALIALHFDRRAESRIKAIDKTVGELEKYLGFMEKNGERDDKNYIEYQERKTKEIKNKNAINQMRENRYFVTEITIIVLIALFLLSVAIDYDICLYSVIMAVATLSYLIAMIRTK